MRGKEKTLASQAVVFTSMQPSEPEAALQSQFAALIEATPDGVALVDPQGVFRYVNPACRSMLGIRQDEPLSALTLFDFCPQESHFRIRQDALPTIFREGQWSAEVALTNRAGHPFLALLTFFAHKRTNAPVSFFSLIVRDISEQKLREAELAYLAHHDALTGLFNRRRFQEELGGRLAQTRRYGGQGALLFVDVDSLKEVNDTLGHQAGDAVLKSLATLLRDQLREVDVIARFGGDEFAVLLSVDAQRAPAVAERLLVALQQQSVTIAGRPLQYTVSIGVAVFPRHGVMVEDLIANADLALYRAKTQGRNQYRLFSTDMKPS